MSGGNSPPSSANYKYKISTDSWTTIASSSAKNVASGVNIDGKFYVLGGRDGGGNYLTTIEAYDSQANSWGNVGTLNTSRYFESVLSYEGTTILVGGGSPAPVEWISDIQQFDPTTGNVAYLATLPAPRMQGCSFIRGNHLIIIGGYGTHSIPGTELNRIDVLNLETKTWSTKLGPNGIMYNQKCIEWNGNYYFFGGDTPFGRSAKVWEFSP
jgi:N-acetylneuraminic acid mutarotase